MKFGTSIMGISLRHFPEVAKAYEDNGFESIWIPEHLVFPADVPPTYPYSETGYPPVTSDTPSYDPWVLLSYIACATERIRLATNVYILPLRHPLQTARAVATLDRVSGGRVTLGVGVGWLEDEFGYVGLTFHDRGRRTDAIIGALRRLWADDVIDVHDEHFDFGPVKFNPKPLQKPTIPIEVGGASRGALRRAGRLGDGWIEIGSSDLDDFKAKVDLVMAARREAGRTGPFEITGGGSLRAGDDVDSFRRLADAGVTRVLVGPRLPFGERLTPDTSIDWAKRFADEVISAF
jgi:probable F420-dependent oxidoreductase